MYANKAKPVKMDPAYNGIQESCLKMKNLLVPAKRTPNNSLAIMKTYHKNRIFFVAIQAIMS